MIAIPYREGQYRYYGKAFGFIATGPAQVVQALVTRADDHTQWIIYGSGKGGLAAHSIKSLLGKKSKEHPKGVIDENEEDKKNTLADLTEEELGRLKRNLKHIPSHELDILYRISRDIYNDRQTPNRA